MANLTGQQVSNTFPSIVGVGTSGTSGLTGTLQPLTDGLGIEIPIEVSTTAVKITAATTTVETLSIDGVGVVINSSGVYVGPGGSSGSAGTAGSSGSSGTS